MSLWGDYVLLPQMRLPSRTKGRQHSGKVPKLRHSLRHSAGNNGRTTCCPSKRSPLKVTAEIQTIPLRKNALPVHAGETGNSAGREWPPFRTTNQITLETNDFQCSFRKFFQEMR
ncbi:unnamed protein product [Larinioides sclopetarius]|uniref:Uncharacterized protein n=1 Tax=Larinioides sclopetarius TaxID=280406 RepID=A0AAV2BIJ1_9ARAC